MTSLHSQELPLLFLSPAVESVRSPDYRSLLERIEVTAPYFALRNIQLDAAGSVHASVDREYEMGLEAGVISIAEAGRHLAILGSLAAAAQQSSSERHYYLAQRARVRAFPPHATYRFPSRGLLASATARLGRREASAQGQLMLPGGDLLYSIHVDYKVMTERVFHRLVGKADGLNTGPHEAPGRDQPALRLQDVNCSQPGLASALLTVRAADCRGHFPDCPALPVAKLMHALALLSGATLRAHEDRSEEPCYVPLRAEISADQLAFAGEQLTLRARLEARTALLAVTQVEAWNGDGACVGQGRFTVMPCR